ncbi:MAG: DUF2703 domain-containing protein [Thermoplasmata archaeon]
MSCRCGNSRKNDGKVCCHSNNTSQKKIIIKWKRLTVDGKTCERCSATEMEIDKAFSALRDALAHLGIEVLLEKETLTLEAFKQHPQSSNEILIDDKPLESYINAKTGHSKCCGVCGDEECRTLETDAERYEIIPAEIIIRAVLLAAANKFDVDKHDCDCNLD